MTKENFQTKYFQDKLLLGVANLVGVVDGGELPIWVGASGSVKVEALVKASLEGRIHTFKKQAYCRVQKLSLVWFHDHA